MDQMIKDYVRSQMSDSERRAFEDKMAKDETLRAEVATLMAAHGAFSNGAGEMPANGWARFSKKLGNEAANDNAPVRFTILQAACIAIAAAAGWHLLGGAIWPSEPAGFATASAVQNEPTLQVVFEPNALISDIAPVLRELDGRIVDGPSALGLYVIAFPDAGTRETAMSSLTEKPEIVSEMFEN